MEISSNTITGCTSGINNTITASTSGINFYSIPELLDVIITKENIEIVYKRQSMVYTGYGMPLPEIYKVVYSRIDGSEKTIFGEYVPAKKESYKF
jgi:hypothetical protein